MIQASPIATGFQTHLHVHFWWVNWCHLSISICLSICVCVCLSIYLSIDLSIWHHIYHMTIQWAVLSIWDIPEPQTIRATGYEVLEAKMTSLATSQLEIHNQVLPLPLSSILDLHSQVGDIQPFVSISCHVLHVLFTSIRSTFCHFFSHQCWQAGRRQVWINDQLCHPWGFRKMEVRLDHHRHDRLWRPGCQVHSRCSCKFPDKRSHHTSWEDRRGSTSCCPGLRRMATGKQKADAAPKSSKQKKGHLPAYENNIYSNSIIGRLGVEEDLASFTWFSTCHGSTMGRRLSNVGQHGVTRWHAHGSTFQNLAKHKSTS